MSLSVSGNSIPPTLWADDLRVAGPLRQTWIDICQKANIDPKALIEKHVDKLLKLVLESTTVEAKVS